MSTAIWVLDALIGAVVVVRFIRRHLPTHKHPERQHGSDVRAPLRAPHDERGAA